MAAKRHINAGSEARAATSSATGRTSAIVCRWVDQFDVARIDRFNRLVRLSQVSGVPASELDWTLHASGHADFAGGGLTRVGETVALARRLSPLDRRVSRPHCGRCSRPGGGAMARVRSIWFDRVFNSTGDGTGYYRPKYADNPLFTDDVKTWVLASTDKDAQAIRTFLAAALAVSDKDLLRIGAHGRGRGEQSQAGCANAVGPVVDRQAGARTLR